MKKLFLLLACTLPAFAQSNRVYNASTYAYTTQVNGGNPSTGSSSLSASPTAFAQGIPFSPYNTNASITINRNAANAETLTPSAVTNCFPNGAGCTLSSTFTFKHITGESIQSGTFGLQEALNIAITAGSGTVLVDASWQGPAGTSTITAAIGNTNVMIQDNRNPSGATFYQWNGSAYVQAGGTNSSLGPNTIYLTTYLANPTVPAQVRWDCSWSVGSSPSTITCPSGTFTPAMGGWIAFATQLTPGGNASVANDFACGGAGTNPVLTYVSSTAVTINTACSVASSGGTSQGGYTFVFGPDETSAVDTWISAVNSACATGILPSGIVLTNHGGGGWNFTAAQNTNCSNGVGAHLKDAIIQGQGQTRSVIGITPAFALTTCTGGPTANTCFGSGATSTSILQGGYHFKDFSFNGFGITIAAVSCCTNYVEFMNDNYSQNFAVTKTSGTGQANTVGIKYSGTFGQFWNVISDWSGDVPCWVAGGGFPFSPNVFEGASECVGGSGAVVTAICASCGTYGLLVTSGGALTSHGSIWAGGNGSNVANDVTIAGGTYIGYGDNFCCTNNSTIMGIVGFTTAGGTLDLDSFNGTLTNMGNGSHFLYVPPAAASTTISLSNTKVVIGGGTGQQCYQLNAGFFIDGGNNSCTGASQTNVFPSNGFVPIGAGSASWNVTGAGPTNFGSNLGSQSMVGSAIGPMNVLVKVGYRQSLLGVACGAGSNTVNGTLNWTQNGQAQTATVPTLTASANGSLATQENFISQTIHVDAGTGVSFTTSSTLASAGCTTTPQYVADYSL